MTKVEAIKALMKEYNGVISLKILYSEIEKYYPDAKKSEEWQAGLRGVLYRDLGKSFKRLDGSLYSLIDYNEIDLLPNFFKDNVVTEKEAVVKIRILQNKYRKDLLQCLKFCPITGISDERLLVASHIKPWRWSSDEEKLDVNNGFVFSPLYDKLFDKGYISFKENGELLISDWLSPQNRSRISFEYSPEDLFLNEQRKEYLKYHRVNVFK